MSWPSPDIIGLSQKARTFAAVFLNEKRLAFQPFVRKRSTLTRLKLSVKFCCAGDWPESICTKAACASSQNSSTVTDCSPGKNFRSTSFLTFHGKQHRHKAIHLPHCRLLKSPKRPETRGGCREFRGRSHHNIIDCQADVYAEVAFGKPHELKIVNRFNYVAFWSRPLTRSWHVCQRSF
jgi:hypothetical protein